tara:strand:+ start:802 stop:1824 length:1023 start_codon:yes stop_codon:yes gene_type:complete
MLDDTIYDKSLLNIQAAPVEKTSRLKKSFIPKLGPQKKMDEESFQDSKPFQINEHAQLGHFSRVRKATKVKDKSRIILDDKNFYEGEDPLIIPFGRMLKCELVNAIDSTNINTPIVGLLMEPLWVDGVLVFPSGTEIHGKASADKVHERITSSSEWVVVFPPNCTKYASKTVKLSGFALDREDRTGEGKTFGIADGSFGIRGYRIQSTELDELKIFAASFLQAALAGLEETEPVGGIFPNSKIKPTARNASLSGSSAVMGEYVEILKKEIEDKGFYTRVPAGKQFYLYINEDLFLYEELGEFKKTNVEKFQMKAEQGIEHSFAKVRDFLRDNQQERDYEE